MTDKCPLLERCRKTTGIDCKGRDFHKCDMLKNVVSAGLYKQARWYLELMPQADKVLIIDHNGKIIRTLDRKRLERLVQI